MDKQLEKILMPVEKIAVNDLLPGYSTPSGKSHAIVVKTKNGPMIANLCSGDYGLVDNRDIFIPLIDTFKDAGLKFDIQAMNHGNTKFYVDFVFQGHEVNFGTKAKPDPVTPKIRAVNSYDLLVKYGISAGIWRLICENGMTAPDQETFKSIRRLHTANFADISLDDTLELVNQFLKDSKAIMEPFKILKDVKVKDNELQEYLEDVAEFTKFPKRQTEMVLQRIIQEKAGKKELDGWLVYNGFNYQLNHNDEINMPPHKKQKLDMEIVDYIAWG